MGTTTEKKLSKGQLAYEQERARKAGKSLDEWMKHKARMAAEEAEKATSKLEKKKGFFSRLLDKAHKPI
ncbi:hypothetical protein [Acidocella aminolytica]|jgi:hypothetical protein|uniref:Uncharacterized protein n=1 Tax=Acidocella aminolytica 101 = DSM 11237 TaxID=1120923 RepID=A0A0D6PEK1_9PROT|nr:hypothetical protein [Acidocella aminolytica]GAN80180.1 hypothetical protein Aam_040_008 [Acidocella aminolytica 101 = DSM 11237]GBQ37351.1 hypothetical protein AA11237_1500 [Acidocella aminolytica 101 = DSM 11237]SHF29215.1 hypothetical protein SAMN02746095_02727 [Acidocella aminolytica 101 = DSM 11237]